MLRHDCSSHGTARSSQNVAQAVLFLRSQRAPRRQGANFRAGSTGAPLPVLARPQPALCSSQQIVQGVHGWPYILLSQNCRPHSRRSQHLVWPGGQGRGQLWLALLQFADRKVQEVEQEGLSSRGQIQVSTQSHARGFLGHHSIRDTKMGVTGNR